MRKLASFAAAFIVAVIFYVYMGQQMPVLFFAGGCLVLSVTAGLLGLRRSCIICLGLAAALIWCRGYDQIFLAPVRELDGTRQILSMKLQEPLSDEKDVPVQICVNGRTYDAVLYGEVPPAEPGDVLVGSVRAEWVEDGRYLRSRGTVLKLYSRDELAVEKGKTSPLMTLRLWLQQRLDESYAGERAALLKALITGDSSELSDAVHSDFSAAGLSHAIAVSGMHVAMLMTMVAFCCGKNPRLTALIGVPVAVCFALMTGASPSSCRAAVMQILLLSAPLMRREYDTLTALGTAALVLLLQNPWVVSSVSFQLSFGAVAGLLMLTPPMRKRLLSLWKKPGWAARFVSTSVAACLGATAFTLPLTVLYFELISLSAVAVNLLTLWAVTGIFVLGLVSCVLPVAAIPAGILADFVLGVCRKAASFPYGAVYPQNLPLMLWAVCAYGVVYWLLLGRKRRLLLPVAVLTVSFCACILWGRWNLSGRDPVYRVLDVGQGQCTLLETKGMTAVIDCGSQYPAEAGNLLVQTLHSGGKSKIDVLVVTHYDDDHAGGVVQVLRRMKVGMVLLPDVPDPSGMRSAMEAAAERSGCRVMAVSSLTELTFPRGKLTVYPPLSGENDNNMGICVLATAAEYDILITGDLDRFTEMKLLGTYDLPEVDLLMAGHHGAKTSTSQTLLDAVQPAAVAVSVGVDNPYNHPAEETIKRIEETGAVVYRTDEMGTLVFRP